MMIMVGISFYIPEMTPALFHAQKFLQAEGWISTGSAKHADAILLGVPSKVTGDLWKTLLEDAPEHAMIFGGNLPEVRNLRTSDLLKDPQYLACNAAITARCALCLLLEKLSVVPDGCPVLVIGWGRIGAALAGCLQDNHADVTVCSRSEKSREICLSLGYHAISPEQLGDALPAFRAVINTAPAPILTDFHKAKTDCLLMDLASVAGILDSRAISARGLPGKMVPESSGELIARSVRRIMDRKETL